MKQAGMVLLCLWVSFASAAKKLPDVEVSARIAADGDGTGYPARGKSKLEDAGCQECHGFDGLGQGPADGGAGKFAKLAGQYPDYMVKQIRDFRSGA